MKAPICRVGDSVFYQGAIMTVVSSYYKLDRWYHDLVHKPYNHTYTTVEKYLQPCQTPVRHINQLTLV